MDDSLTSADLMRRFNAHVAERLGDVFHDALTGKITPRAQDHREATWVARRDADDCLIDFTRSNRYLSLFFRALVDPYPLPQIVCAKGRFEITSHRLVRRDYEGGEGRVVHIDGEGGWIKVCEGLLIVRELRATDGSLHAAGRVLKRGERLA